MNPRTIWQRWTSPTVAGELACRREAVLLNVLATLVCLAIAAQVIQWASRLAGRDNPQFWIWWPLMALVSAGFYGLLHLARAGRHRMSAGLLIAILSLLAGALLLDDGFEHPLWALLSALSVLLAALLLGERPATLVAFGHAVLLVSVAALEAGGVGLPLTPAQAQDRTGAAGSLVPALALWLITRSCWLYTRELLTSVDELLTHGSASSPLRQLRTKTLTVREIEVAQLVAEGLTNGEIARKLFLSPRTVQSHVANAMGKSECPNRTALGVLAIREGLVPLVSPEAVADVWPRQRRASQSNC